MSRRSLNTYQRKYKIIPLRKIEKFLHKYSNIILANSKAVYTELIEEGVKEEIKINLWCEFERKESCYKQYKKRTWF